MRFLAVVLVYLTLMSRFYHTSNSGLQRSAVPTYLLRYLCQLFGILSQRLCDLVSPNISRGSIQPTQRIMNTLTCTTAPIISLLGLPGNAASTVHTVPQPYRLASSGASTNDSSTLTIATTTSLPVSVNSQPLAAFFTSPSVSSSTAQCGATVEDGGTPLVRGASTLAGMTNHAAANAFTPQQQPQHSVTSFRVPMECTHIAKGHSNAVLDVDIKGDLLVTGSKGKLPRHT